MVQDDTSPFDGSFDCIAMIGTVLSYLLRLLEASLFFMVKLYDQVIYTPIQVTHAPVVALIPRNWTIFGRSRTVWTANTVTYARTCLVLPIVFFLRSGNPAISCGLVVLHDYLDHVDGIVAQVQRRQGSNPDESLFGGFLDAFCDKIVNVMSLWSILLITKYDQMSTSSLITWFSVIGIVIGYEVLLGVVRVQDYYRALSMRRLGQTNGRPATSAAMEGKLKEKLESVGIALLCLSTDYGNPLAGSSGVVGLVCLGICIRLAHASLTHKLKNRKLQMNDFKTSNHGNKIPRLGTKRSPVRTKSNYCSLDDSGIGSESLMSDNDPFMKYEPVEKKNHFGRPLARKVDKVYTVGCFDLFHEGHVRLLDRMRAAGKEVIVGVHDSRSIYKLKKRVPIDDTCTRMSNVKAMADEVFVISGTDPSMFIKCIVNLSVNQSAMYMRGDDMPNFPGRGVVEDMMPVRLVPYTRGISSTQLRKRFYPEEKFVAHLDDSQEI